MALINVVPMSGKGARFADSGYLLPKPLIPVSGKPMILKVIESMPNADKWFFIVKEEHIQDYAIDLLIQEEIPGAVILVDNNPQGQASTCYMVMDYIDEEDSVFVSACDNAFIYNKEKYKRLIDDKDKDVIVWTFTNDDLLEESPTSWGWVKLQNDKKTVETVSVKIPISSNPRSDHAIVGAFFFRKAKDFKDAYFLMVDEKYKINNEYYIDSMIIFLKQLHKTVVIFDVDFYIGWGKPADLYVYQKKEYLYRVGKLKGGLVNYFDC